MKKVVDNLHESEFINKISPSNLTCFERPRLIALDSIIPNSMFLHLLFGKDIESGVLSSYFKEKIEEMYNVDIKFHYEDGDHFFDNLEYLIDNNSYIILVVNLFYSKDHTYYFQKKHHPHFILLKGYDVLSEKYIVIDEIPSGINDLRTDFNPYVEQLIDKHKLRDISLKVCEISDFSKDINNQSFNSCYLYSIIKYKSPEIKQLNINDIVNLYKQKVLELRNNIKYIENIIKDNILLFESLYSEKYIGLKSIYPVPKELQVLFKHTDSLVIQQKVFELAISCLDEYNYLESLFYDVIDLLKKMISLLTKRIFTNNPNNTNRILADYIYQISEKEILLYDEILALLDKEDIGFLLEKARTANKFNTVNIPEPSCQNHNVSMTFVNLNNYFNSRVFLNQKNPDKINDYICNYERFLINNTFNNEYLLVSNMKFYNPNINEDKYDNISCNGEVILIPKGYYNSIMLLGFSEWGSFREKIIINYNTIESQKLLVSFSDCSSKPIYGEAIAWEGEKLQLGKNLHSKAYLFANTYDLESNQEIESIILPNSPNIHLIAISLGILS